MTYSYYPDETLLELIKSNDSSAFEELYKRHNQTVHNLVVRIVSDRAAADEIAQETFWQAWKTASEFRGAGSAAAWLYKIARTKSLELTRQKQSVPVGESSYIRGRVDEPSPLPELPTMGVSLQPALVERQADHQQLDRQHLLRALASIPGEQRACLELAYFEGFSQSQIANQLGIPLSTVKTRIRMGLEKLEHILRAAGYKEK